MRIEKRISMTRMRIFFWGMNLGKNECEQLEPERPCYDQTTHAACPDGGMADTTEALTGSVGGQADKTTLRDEIESNQPVVPS